MRKALVFVTALGVCWYAYAVSPPAPSSSSSSPASEQDGKRGPPPSPPNLNLTAMLEKMKTAPNVRDDDEAQRMCVGVTDKVDYNYWYCFRCFWGSNWCFIFSHYGAPVLFGPCWVVELVYGCLRPFFWWYWGFYGCFTYFPKEFQVADPSSA